MTNQIKKGIVSCFIPILYILIICPISILLRLINKKFIPTKFDQNKNSYWLLKHEKNGEETEDFNKQF